MKESIPDKRQRLSMERLARAQKFFEKLDEELSSGLEPENSTLQFLKKIALDYSTNDEMLQYRACVRLYKFFKAGYKYPVLKEGLKKLLRPIVKKHFLKEPSSQLSLGFAL